MQRALVLTVSRPGQGDMDQGVYMPPGPGAGGGGGPPAYTPSPAPYRGPGPPPVSVAPPQGSKLATYLNRGGSQPQQPPQNFHDINNKMTNLSLLNRPPTPSE